MMTTCITIFLILLVLKITGLQKDLTWGIVTAPLWIYLIIFLFVAGIAITVLTILFSIVSWIFGLFIA